MQHVDLYVNDWTLDLGAIGAKALDELSTRAASLGLAAGRLVVFAG
jgi:1,4-dihydroxy-6-naphthoate synthase